MIKYPCPCCGYLTLEGKPPGTFEICPVCYWEDDPQQFAHPDDPRGSNGASLRQGRTNFRAIGACERKYINAVRKPLAVEIPKV